MKKLLIAFSASILLFVGAKAQVDLSFDSTWVPNSASPGSYQDPVGWTSFNTASVVGMLQTVSRVSVNPAFGVASARVVTRKTTPLVQVPNPFRHGQNFDTVGLLCLGSINLTLTPPLTFGQPLNVNRPQWLSFSSKDSSVVGDSAFVLVYLTKWNPLLHKRDTIASGKFGENGISSSWTSHVMNLNYNSPTIVPDSQQIFVSSSIYMRPGAKYGSVYYVDQFCWECTAGISENGIDYSVSLYPNPATNEINFTTSLKSGFVQIMDITGRTLGTYAMQNSSLRVDTENLKQGIYLYSVLNEKKEIIKNGRFEIVR
ncbi:MAG: T9SS type A sorting domain-containing protein [Bacteroidota bacterium]